MNTARRLVGWLTSETPRQSEGLQVFEGGGRVHHLAEAQQRAKPGRGVRIPEGLAQDILAVLRALASETAAPYVLSFLSVDGWRMEMRLAIQKGRLITSELHVTPERPDAVPPGGISARALRRVPLHARDTQFAGMRRGAHTREEPEMLVGVAGL